MITHISRDKLPKGLSYVLKTSQLAEALADAHIEVDVGLTYSIRDGLRDHSWSILEGHYWLPNERVPNSRIYVRAGTIPSALRPAAVKSLSTEALPAFIRWARHLVTLPDGSTEQDASPYFNASYTVDGLKITDSLYHRSR